MTEQRGSFVEWLATKQAEPKVITVQRFACQFCHRGHSTRKAAEQHIARCWKNPALRGCKSCIHFEAERAEPEVGLPGSELCMADAIDLSAGLRSGCPLWEAAS
jgi:hypothetical protein